MKMSGDLCINDRPSNPTYDGAESAAPYDTVPGSEAIFEGQPLTMPTQPFPQHAPDWPAGTIVAPPIDQPLNPGFESPIPVPSIGPDSNSFRESQGFDTHPPGVAPLPPESVPQGTLLPGRLYPAPSQPSPLPPGDPDAKSIHIPDPALPSLNNSKFVPSVPGTAGYSPIRRMEIPLQPTSHFQPATNRSLAPPQQDGSEWRVMRGYYDRRPDTGISSR